jgi:hypothetical protein
MRIHVLGGPGSGKTTLAKTLSGQFSLPHYDLDQVLWKHASRQEGYVDEALTIAAQPAWVSEGIFLVWVDPLLEQANAIIWMEVPWRVAVWRILKRHFTLTLRRANPYPTSALYPFLKDTRRYYLASSDPTSIAQVLDARDSDVAPLSREHLLKRMASAAATVPLTADFTRRYLEKYRAKLTIVQHDSDRSRLLAQIQALNNHRISV